MRISFTDEVEGGRVLYPIGRVQAATPWQGANLEASAEDLRKAALQALIATAEEVEADAIIGVDYSVDGVNHTDLSTIELRRISATGIAVKLAAA